jgi:hypothetical protein
MAVPEKRILPTAPNAMGVRRRLRAESVASTVVIPSVLFEPSLTIGPRDKRSAGEPFAVSHGIHPQLAERFDYLAAEWHKGTRLVSSITRMAMHPAYQQIIGMGPAAIPLILQDLARTRDHWLWALYSLTGQDPAPPDANFDQAVDAWLQWGRNQGHL